MRMSCFSLAFPCKSSEVQPIKLLCTWESFYETIDFSSLSTAHSRRFEIRASSCQTCSGDLGMCLGLESRRKTFGRLCFGNTSELHSCPSTSFYIICWFGKNILTICLRHQESNTQLCCKDFWWRNFLLITTAAPRKENEEKSSLGFYFTG